MKKLYINPEIQIVAICALNNLLVVSAGNENGTAGSNGEYGSGVNTSRGYDWGEDDE